tara:strand:+ start:1415 stop:1966 length:552 start_codon:yes stop_codon:yes gene_type:complete
MWSKRKCGDRKRIMKILVVLLLMIPGVVFGHSLEKQMPEFIEFIETNSLYEYRNTPLPEIVIVNEKDVCTGAYGKPVDTCDIAGYYNDDTNQIYIRNEPTQYMVEDRFQEVILLHELVHYLQYMDGTYEIVECRANLEQHAYDLQEKYIDAEGIDEQQKPDPLFALISSMCPNQHPLMFNSEQ